MDVHCFVHQTVKSKLKGISVPRLEGSANSVQHFCFPTGMMISAWLVRSGICLNRPKTVSNTLCLAEHTRTLLQVVA